MCFWVGARVVARRLVLVVGVPGWFHSAFARQLC